VSNGRRSIETGRGKDRGKGEIWKEKSGKCEGIEKPEGREET